ncbi:FG-GAP repeat domain-containing protein [Thermoplasmatota archaeon]
MKRLIPIILVMLILLLNFIGIISAFSISNSTDEKVSSQITTNGYGIQWMKEYGSSPFSGARYQGPQPIGDCDNDGYNELLISGRDCAIRVMEWNENEQTYSQVSVLRPPLYPLVNCDAGGMAIGDVTNDGDNEIAATWYTSIHKYINSKYRIIGLNPYIFFNKGGSADCLIGDCDNDGENEIILSGGSLRRQARVAEITVFKWNGLYLERVAEWDDPDENGYVYMAGIGDVDDDGENEIVCAYENKIMVLNWDDQTNKFISTKIKRPNPIINTPFGIVCKDCDNDGKVEILLSYYDPRITIFKWDGTDYPIQFDITWPEGEPVIEGIDVGDTDNDGFNEVVVGAGETHILQWNGSTYIEEAVLPTFGWMAVVCIGDCDNDGKNEINAGNVYVESGQKFTEWIFKYGW